MYQKVLHAELAPSVTHTQVQVVPDTPIDTFTANPSTDTLTVASNHGLAANDRVIFTTTGTLPGGLPSGAYVSASGLTANTLKVSATPGGAVIDITSAGTGVHTIWRPRKMADMQMGPNTGYQHLWGVVDDLGLGGFEVDEVFLPDGFVGQPYSINEHFTDIVLVTVVSGSLPPGLTLTQPPPPPDSFTISGTPTTAGDYYFILQESRGDVLRNIPCHLTILDAPAGAGESAFVGGV